MCCDMFNWRNLVVAVVLVVGGWFGWQWWKAHHCDTCCSATAVKKCACGCKCGGKCNCAASGKKCNAKCNCVK